LRIANGGVGRPLGASAHRSLSVSFLLRGIWCGGSSGSPIFLLAILIVVTATVPLSIATPHPHITPNTNATSLFGDGTAEGRALGQSGELLGAIDDEIMGLNMHSEVEGSWRAVLGAGWVFGVFVLVLFGLFVQVERQFITTLVANRQIREQEVASQLGSVKISHAGDRHASQHRRCVGRRGLESALGHDTGMLERGIEEEVGVMLESDIPLLGDFIGFTLKDAQLHDRRRVHRATVGG